MLSTYALQRKTIFKPFDKTHFKIVFEVNVITDQKSFNDSLKAINQRDHCHRCPLPESFVCRGTFTTKSTFTKGTAKWLDGQVRFVGRILWSPFAEFYQNSVDSLRMLLRSLNGSKNFERIKNWAWLLDNSTLFTDLRVSRLESLEWDFQKL